MTVRIRLYRWRGVRQAFAVAYTDAAKRDGIIARMARAVGELPAAVAGGDWPIANVRDAALRAGWERNARSLGAVLATGLGAL